MSLARSRRGALLASGVLALAYLLAPGHGLTWIRGIPLEPLALGCVVLLGVLAFAWPPNPEPTRPLWMLAGVLALLVAAKLAFAWLSPTYGLPGWYWANSRFQGTPERSSEFPRESGTRRDRELDFGGDEFAVYFLNDSERFNFFGPEAERRRSLPYSVRWEGALYVPRDDQYRFWVTSSGPAQLLVDGVQVREVGATRRDTETVVLPLSRGTHGLGVTYARKPPGSGLVRIEWELDGRRRRLAVPYLLAGSVAPEAWERDQVVALGARAVDALFLALLAMVMAGLVGRWVWLLARTPSGRLRLVERPLLGLLLLLVFAHAALPALDRADKMTFLGGGQDWLTHETLARDILLNGPLMTLGKPLGEGRPYYAQPLYPYALALMHWLSGEDQFGPTVLQLLGLGVAGVLLYFLAKRLFGTPAAVGTLGLFIALRAWQLDWVARRLLSENLYFVLLPATLLVLLRYVDERRRRDLVLGGLLLGMAILTRGPTLLYLPLAALVVTVALRRHGVPGRRAMGAVAGLVALALAVVALVPLRNWVVARQPAIVATSGGVNLEKLHRPTSQVRLGEAARRWYAPYIQDVPTREVLEFIQQDPRGYAASYVPLALYTLGYGAALEESNIALWPDLVLLNLLYLAAIVGSHRARTLRAALLHLFVATHFLTMVVFAPYDYENRLVLPMYLLITVFAGFSLATAVAWAARRVRQPRPEPVRARLTEPPAA